MISTLKPHGFGAQLDPCPDRPALEMIADEEHAQLLQRHALQALQEVRSWVWGHHQLPDAPTVTREAATAYAAYLEWVTRLDIALNALDETASVEGL